MVGIGVGKKRRVVSERWGLVPDGVKESGVTGGVTGGVKTSLKKKTPLPLPVPEKMKVPNPLVEQDRKPTPKVKEPNLKEVVTPAKRELGVELQKIQQHDPDVVPTQGGGYGRIVRNRAGQPIGTIPVADPTPEMNPKMWRLISEVIIDKLRMNTAIAHNGTNYHMQTVYTSSPSRR